MGIVGFVRKVKNIPYKKELEKEHRGMDEKRKAFLKPCECCGKFLLLDFEICPICGHQQNVE